MLAMLFFACFHQWLVEPTCTDKTTKQIVDRVDLHTRFSQPASVAETQNPIKNLLIKICKGRR